MGQPFMIGPRGAMREVPAAPGTPVAPARGVQEVVTGDGSVFFRRTAKAPRTWSLVLGPWSTPETNRVILAAASGEMAGDLWLLDRAAGRANMLYADQTCGQDRSFPVLDVDGIPLRSLTPDAAEYTQTVYVPASASTYVDAVAPSSAHAGESWLLVDGTRRSLLRFDIPPAPAGATALNASIEFIASGAGTIAVDFCEVSGGWSETVTYATAPLSGPVRVGGVTIPSPVTGLAIPLPLVIAEAGVPLNLAVTRTSYSGDGTAQIQSRYAGPELRLRLNYTVQPAADPTHTVARVPLRAGQQYTMIAYADTDAGPVLEFDEVPDDGSADVQHTLTASAAGDRAAGTFTAATDSLLDIRTTTTPTLLAGLRLIEGPDDGALWIPGQGAWARITVLDPGQTMQQAADAVQALSDYTVTVREAGTPGEV